MMSQKKSFALRMDAELFEALERWAADEFRSVNGQIEWVLNQQLKAAGRLKPAAPVAAPAAAPAAVPAAASAAAPKGEASPNAPQGGPPAEKDKPGQKRGHSPGPIGQK